MILMRFGQCNSNKREIFPQFSAQLRSTLKKLYISCTFTVFPAGVFIRNISTFKKKYTDLSTLQVIHFLTSKEYDASNVVKGGREMSWGLALGSGGIRGAAYIGILKVLLKNGLCPDFIAGASAGAVVSAFYAAGISPEKMESMAILGLKGLLGKSSAGVDTIIPRIKKQKVLPAGLFDGNTLEKALKNTLSNKSFSELIIPTAIIATDLGTGKTIAYSNERYPNKKSNVVFVPGTLLHEAVRASISLPGLFVPKEIGSRRLIQSGVTGSIPEVLLDMGAKKIIAVDLGLGKTKEADNMIKVLLQTIDIINQELSALSNARADLVLKPDVSGAGLLDFSSIPALIKAGEKAARDNLETMKKIVFGN